MSEEIKKILKKKIKKKNYLSLEEFFSIALYEKKQGYYASQEVIGKKGDFITAPEISQVFGEMIANWIILNLRLLNFSNYFSLSELGPGRGTLMNDILRTIRLADKNLHDNIKNICFLERSAKFKLLLKEKFVNCKIFKNINLLPKNYNVIIANEFFDAIPLNQYVFKDNNWFERIISLDSGENFCFKLVKKHIGSNIFFPINVEEGRVFEYSNDFIKLNDVICKNIKKYGGFLLIIDYAKENTEKSGTLFSIKEHKYKNPFDDLGTSDISFKPNFEVIKKIAEINNCFVLGPSTQSEFLKRMGINERFKILIKHNPKKELSLLKQKERLILSKEMGEKFKIIAIFSKTPEIKYGFK